MNKPEKKAFLLLLFLLGVGTLIRLLPMDPVPAIDDFSVEESFSASVNETPSFEKPVLDSKRVFSSKSKAKKKPEVVFPIAINTASSEELCALKGVGPKLAEKIIAHRKNVGSFKMASDLLKVPGIGEKKSKNILQYVIFD